MPELPAWGWLLLASGALATVLGVLHVLACAIRNDTALHDLRVRVADLRRQHLERQERLARQDRGESEEPIEVGEAVDEPARNAA